MRKCTPHCLSLSNQVYKWLQANCYWLGQLPQGTSCWESFDVLSSTSDTSSNALHSMLMTLKFFKFLNCFIYLQFYHYNNNYWIPHYASTTSSCHGVSTVSTVHVHTNMPSFKCTKFIAHNLFTLSIAVMVSHPPCLSFHGKHPWKRDSQPLVVMYITHPVVNHIDTRYVVMQSALTEWGRLGG